MTFPNSCCRLYSLSCAVTEVSVPISQWSATDLTYISLNTWSQKNPKTRSNLSWSLQIGSKLGTPAALSQATYKSALVFISCLHGAQRLAKDASLGSSLVFSEHMSSPGHMCCSLDRSRCAWQQRYQKQPPGGSRPPRAPRPPVHPSMSGATDPCLPGLGSGLFSSSWRCYLQREVEAQAPSPSIRKPTKNLIASPLLQSIL